MGDFKKKEACRRVLCVKRASNKQSGSGPWICFAGKKQGKKRGVAHTGWGDFFLPKI
jgi:hypothetical protein